MPLTYILPMLGFAGYVTVVASPELFAKAWVLAVLFLIGAGGMIFSWADRYMIGEENEYRARRGADVVR